VIQGKILEWNLQIDIIISLIKPNAGKIDICASGCLRNQDKCWGNNKSNNIK